MTVTWATPDSCGSYVQYGFTTNYGNEIQGEAYFSSCCNQYIHNVLISSFEPDTLYHYRCGCPGEWSGDRTFRSGKMRGESLFNFIFYGDTRTDTIERVVVRDAMIRHLDSIRFILHGGDIVEYGSAQWRWDIFFRQMEPLISNCPMMPTIGNHDEYGSRQNYLDQFVLPQESGTEMFYSLDYGSMHIVSLYDPTPGSRIKPGDPQYFWLMNDLANASINPDIDWKIIFFHVPPYSAGYGYLNQRNDIVPICDSFDVDLVFCGHTHNYERTFLLYDSVIVDSGPDYNGDLNGTVYVVSGGGCAPLSDAHVDWWTAYSEEAYHFMLISVGTDRIKVKVLGDDGVTHIDEWSLTKSPEIDFPGGNEMRILKVYPIPSTGSIIISGINPRRRGDEIMVINSAGQKVRSLIVRGSSLIWDGRDENDHQVNPGVYFLILKDENHIRREKIIVLN